jgi:hypothetical protein
MMPPARGSAALNHRLSSAGSLHVSSLDLLGIGVGIGIAIDISRSVWLCAAQSDRDMIPIPISIGLQSYLCRVSNELWYRPIVADGGGSARQAMDAALVVPHSRELSCRPRRAAARAVPAARFELRSRFGLRPAR